MPLIRNKRELEGEVILDHSGSPGFTAAEIAESEKMGLPCPVAPEGAVFKSATITCRCCTTVVVLNPDRTRQRHYCPNEDRYICDGCEAKRQLRGNVCCKSFSGRFERLLKWMRYGGIGTFRDENYDP